MPSPQEAVYWHQGMFLQPRHFQLTQRWVQSLFGAAIDTGLPHAWGVGHIEVAPAAAAAQRFELRGAELLFREHDYVAYPGNAVVATRRIEDAGFGSRQRTLVYLGLRRFDPHGANVTACGDSAMLSQAPTRYAALTPGDEGADLHSKGPAAQVVTLVYVLRVFWESELEHLDDYELIPVARLRQDPAGVSVDTTYIPPCYALRAAPALQHLLEGLRDECAIGVQRLRALKRPRRSGSAARIDDLELRLALASLARVHARLQHALECPEIHPWEVYGALRECVGELSIFTDASWAQTGYPEAEPYAHQDLNTCFGRTRDRIELLLRGVNFGPEVLLPMLPRDGLMVAELPGSMLDARKSLYLLLRSSAPLSDWAPRVAGELRLASPTEALQLTARALPGLRLHDVDRVPQGLPQDPQLRHWRVQRDSELWAHVCDAHTLALHWPGAPADLQAELALLGV